MTLNFIEETFFSHYFHTMTSVMNKEVMSSQRLFFKNKHIDWTLTKKCANCFTLVQLLVRIKYLAPHLFKSFLMLP